MTKRLRILVLIGLGQLGLIGGPIEKTQAAPLAPPGLTTYAAFMELAGPLWLLEVPGATFDSAFHYPAEGTAAVPSLDPLAGDLVLVPEPRSGALLGAALAILLVLSIRRRRRTHSH